MPAFSKRLPGYKAGVVLLFFSTPLFFLGYVAPFWDIMETTASHKIVSVTLSLNQGLWMMCVKASVPFFAVGGCKTSVIGGLPPWFQATRVLGFLGLLGLVAACIYTFAVNCCRSHPGPHNRVLEIIACASGLLGFTGCMVYAGMHTQGKWYEQLISEAVSVLSSSSSVDRAIGWAMILAAGSSSVSIAAGIIIGIFNKPTTAGNTQTSGMEMGVSVVVHSTQQTGALHQPQI